MKAPYGNGLASAVLDALPDATAAVDPDGAIMAVNLAWRMFSVDNGGAVDRTGVGVNYFDLCVRSAASGCHDADLAAAGLRAVLDGQTVQSELEYPCPSPSVNRWFLLRITPLAGSERGAVASHVNITRRKAAEQILSDQAAHDPLTGLANRNLFIARLTAALSDGPGRASAPDVGVIYIDLNGFKQVNDTYGHDAGDEVLLRAVHRLRQQIRPDDTAARMGGDEFAITAPRLTAEGLAAMAARIADVLAEPHLIHGRRIRVPASVGSYLAGHRESAASALRCADQAMYVIKRAGSGRAPIKS